MRILVIGGDYWHPFEVVRRGLAGLPGAEFDFVEDAKDILSPSMLREYPLILLTKGDTLTSANQNPWFEEGVTQVQPSDFADYLQQGGAILSVHAGNCFRQEKTPAMTELLGNTFLGHPRQCPITILPQGEHPITRGITPFTLQDEHYNLRLLCEDAQVFLTTHSDACSDQVGGYTRQIGKGRLCVLTPGHNGAMWAHPMFRQLLTQAIVWCTHTEKA